MKPTLILRKDCIKIIITLFIQTTLITFGYIRQNANWPVIFFISTWVFLENWFMSAYFNCSGKVLFLREWLVLIKENSEKMSAFCLVILVGPSRSLEAFKIFSSQVTFVTSSRLKFSMENLLPEFSSFILRMLGCFSKVLIAFTIKSLFNFKTMQKPIHQNKAKRFLQFCFLPKWLCHFQKVFFFHLLVSFQLSLVF